MLKVSFLTSIYLLIAVFHLHLSYLLFTGDLIKEVRRENIVVFEGFVSRIGESSNRVKEVTVITDGKEYVNKEVSNNITERLIVGKDNKLIDTKVYKNVSIFSEILIYYFVVYMFFIHLLVLGYHTIFSSCFQNKSQSVFNLAICLNIFSFLVCSVFVACLN